EAVGKCMQLSSLAPERERDADLLPAFRSNLVRLYLLPPGRRSADQVSREEEVVEVPKVIGILHAHLDLPRLRVAVEDAHRIRAMEGDRISAYRGRPGRVNMLSIRAMTFSPPSIGWMKTSRRVLSAIRRKRYYMAITI